MPKGTRVYIAVLLGIFSWCFFLFFQTQGIYAGDSGDLVTAAATGGVAHPPGYPLFVFLGFLLSKYLPFSPSWSVTLLSSLSHAVVISLVYLFVYDLTQSLVSSLFASLLLLGNYVFFLYSITPEVFGMLDLFVMFLLYVLFLWTRSAQVRYVYMLAFLFGLSLTHHHMVVFVVPSFAYAFWYHAKHNKKQYLQLHHYVWILFLFFIGFSPYIYVFFAGNGSSIINWNKPTTLGRFFHLLSRADYGTFVSGPSYGAAIIDRLLQIKAYIQFFLIDYKLPGLILLFIGVMSLYKKSKIHSLLLLTLIVIMGPLFLAYASFPLLNRFTLGTYERFLLPSYCISAVGIGYGLYMVISWYKKRFIRSSTSLLQRVLYIVFIVMLFSYPTLLIGMNVWRMFGFAKDETANNLARDILASAEPDSIVLLRNDTPLFTTQYVRYALKERPDVYVIHVGRLAGPDYPMTLKKVFPELIYTNVENGGLPIEDFILSNIEYRSVYSNTDLPVGEEWYWVQYGLLYKLVNKNKIPDIDSVYEDNMRLWDMYHKPRSGVLSRYNHLMLSDVLNVYASMSTQLGNLLYRAEKYDLAHLQYERALMYNTPHLFDMIYKNKGLNDLARNECESAKTSFETAEEHTQGEDSELLLFMAQTYSECFQDEKKAQELYMQYKSIEQSQETAL